jgi:hypothetical protein
MQENLASIREIVDLSPQAALDSAEDFLTRQGYGVAQRTPTTLTVERQDSGSTAEDESKLTLVVLAVLRQEPAHNSYRPCSARKHHKRHPRRPTRVFQQPEVFSEVHSSRGSTWVIVKGGLKEKRRPHDERSRKI